jgi:nucleoside-diphosphate-sugar epimerase
VSGLLRNDLELIQRDLEPIAADLRGAVVCVTGASGFFGRNLVEGLAALDRSLDLRLHLVVTGRDARRLHAATAHLARSSKISVVAGDVRDLAVPLRPTHVIHAATAASAVLNAAAPGEMISVIVDGTRAALAATEGAQRTLFVSSGAVYGAQPSDLSHVDEECRFGPDPLVPGAAYGEGKRLAETLCGIAAAQGRSVTIARCFAFVGPWLPLDAHFAIGNFIGNALMNAPIEVSGDGTAVRSYLYAADLVVWLVTALLRGQSGRAYNVGSDHAVSVGELARMVGEAYRVPVHIRGAPTGKPPARYVPSVERARRELGLRQTVELDDAIARTVAWHRAAAHHPLP